MACRFASFSPKVLRAPRKMLYRSLAAKFSVAEIRVSSDALVLQLDFELTVK